MIQICARRLERWREAESDSREQRHCGGDAEHKGIDRYLVHTGDVHRAQQVAQSVHRPKCQQQSEHSSEQREHQTLREQLAGDASTARP
jgi:hypothetical protein